MLEIRQESIFAKILAREDIIVFSDPTLPTAFFDLEQRRLGLPVWDVHEDVNTMLVGHEVSHALHTPTKEYMGEIKAQPEAEQKSFGMIMNIVEDARIDKMIQRKYPGMRAWYRSAQGHMIKDDIFGLGGKDPNELSLVNRLNLHFKTNFDGSYKIDFKTPEEQAFLKRMEDLETIDEVIKLAHELWEHAKQNGEAQEIQQIQIAMEKWLEGQRNDGEVRKITEIPRQTPESTPWKDWYTYYGPGDRGLFKARTRPVVSFLVSEFLRHQKAQELQRTKESKTGILDMKRLFQYQYEEDIFLYNQITPTGKNHGFVMLIDLSSSMGSVFNSVVKQVYILAMFCKRLQIPFEIYGFSETGQYKTQSTPFGNVALLELATGTLSQAQLDFRFSRLLDMQLASGGTPFSASLSMMPEILVRFRAGHKVENLQFVILSDGDCNVCAPEGAMILDHASKLNVSVGDSFNSRLDYTSALYHIIRARSGAKITNFFLTSCRGVEEVKNTGGLDRLYKINPSSMFGGEHKELFLMRKLAETFG